MSKIIVNSKYFYKNLQYIVPLIAKGDEYTIQLSCTNDVLKFSTEFCVVESKLLVQSEKDFDIKVQIGQLKTLSNLLNIIQEQPLTISFKNSSGWAIDVGNIII